VKTTLSASLTGVAGVTQGDQTVELCIGSGSNMNSVIGFLVSSAGTVYVKPMTSSKLRTVYQTFWQGTGSIYEVAGQHLGGIPGATGNTVYQAQPSGLATVHVQLRNLENTTPLQAVIETYGGCGTTTLPENLLPDVYTDHRTPGPWTTDLNFGPPGSPLQVQRDLFKSAKYQAGHTYSDLFDSAAAGPGRDFPVIDGHNVDYSPNNLFSDPVVGLGFDCEGQADVSLHRGPTLIKGQALTFCGNPSVFSAHVKKSGGVTLAANAARFNPSGSVPVGELSPAVNMVWRFRFSPVTGHPINAQAAPVTVTRFLPQGLGFDNDAQGPTTTTLKFVILRGGGQPVATPVYRLRTVRVYASTNDGATWQLLSAAPHSGGYWLAHVNDPAFDGYVSLRSVVTDVHGNSTTETIIRAYRVFNGTT
jgi:hypothetical protein